MIVAWPVLLQLYHNMMDGQTALTTTLSTADVQ